MEWKTAQVNDKGLIKVPESWLHLHYYEALNILFRFENSLRIFVYVVLKNNFLENWKDCEFSVGSEESSSIKNISSKRISQAESFGYLGFEVSSPLMHLTSGELVELITSETYWPKFNGYFKGKKDIIKNKLLEIGTVRNSLAHFRPIKPEDIELIKQNSRHTLLGVEEVLNNIFNFPVRVPTNTKDEWYKPISTLGTDNIQTTPYYSQNENWVNIQLSFKSPVFRKRKLWETHYSYQVAKINPANILNEKPNLSKYIVYVSEYVNYPQLKENHDIEIRKDINIIINKNILTANHIEIAQELQNTLVLISEECDLLSKDTLARGKLIESSRISSSIIGEGDQAGWKHNYTSLSQPYVSGNPDEYWGLQQFSLRDVVATCPQYPWMPSEISGFESPF